MQRVLSGIQPTADSYHLGNYLGALKQWIDLQDSYEAFYFIPDMHALTVRFDPSVLAGARAVVSLGGASIGRFPWTKRYKHELVWSRLAPTQAIAAAVREGGPARRSAQAPFQGLEPALDALLVRAEAGEGEGPAQGRDACPSTAFEPGPLGALVR